MTPKRGWYVVVALVLAMVLVLAMASVAVARFDEFGGSTAAAPYAPYTAGPVVPSAEAYAPYDAGPVIHASDKALFAPYTSPITGVGDHARLGNYLVR